MSRFDGIISDHEEFEKAFDLFEEKFSLTDEQVDYLLNVFQEFDKCGGLGSGAPLPLSLHNKCEAIKEALLAQSPEKLIDAAAMSIGKKSWFFSDYEEGNAELFKNIAIKNGTKQGNLRP